MILKSRISSSTRVPPTTVPEPQPRFPLTFHAMHTKTKDTMYVANSEQSSEYSTMEEIWGHISKELRFLKTAFARPPSAYSRNLSIQTPPLSSITGHSHKEKMVSEVRLRIPHQATTLYRNAMTH